MWAWDERYPNKAQLRLEIRMMQESIKGAIFALTERDNIIGIYAKGSSVKTWDSPLDYVPELSDLDIHLLLHDDSPFTSIPKALSFQTEMEGRFGQRIPKPLHLPRPQIQLLRSRLQQYSPSSLQTVKTLYGLPYQELKFGQQNHPQADRRMLLEPRAFLDGFFETVMDRHGRYMFDALRQLAWRVGPTGSRVLSVLGADFETAWGGNRTHIYQQLLKLGQTELAKNYAQFYLQAWDFFCSGYQNTNAARKEAVNPSATYAAAREAGLAGVRVLELGLAIGGE